MSKGIIPIRRVVQAIRFWRGEKVLLDSDLAELYGVTTGNLNKAVARNRKRFPIDFMFQLTAGETDRLIFQFGRSKGRGGRRHRPYVFTEQGVAMAPQKKPGREIGFHVREKRARYRARNGR